MRHNPLLRSLAAYPQAVLEEKKRQVRAAGRRLYDFGTGDPLEPTPAFITRAIRDAVPEVSQYPTVAGPTELREAIAGYLARRFGVALDPGTQVLPTSGSKEAIFHLPLAFLDPAAPDRTVVFPDPGYPVYQRGALFAGGEAHAMVLEGDFVQRVWELPEEVLRRTRVVYVNSPHNPTGAVLDRDALRRTWETCRRHDALLVADECYADVYAEDPPPSVLEIATEGVIAVHSLSKRSGMTGYRSGFFAGDAEAIALLRTSRINFGVAPQDVVNAGASAAWRDDAHAAERRDLLRRKKQVFRVLFADLGLEVIGLDATLYLWVRCPPGVDEDRYALRLLEAGIVVSPGQWFGVAGGGGGYVRVAMVPPLPECIEAVDAWRRVHEEERWRP